ncbi:MAG: TetR/AcrR family transcriptional regulator [Sphingobium sp.]
MDTREYLIQAAADVMIAKDSADISLSEIADKTGLSAALVQYHFGNKEGLLVALLERDGAKALGQLRQLEAMDLSAPAKLRIHVGGLSA